MATTPIRDGIDVHVTTLAERIGPRPSGSPAGRAATDYVEGVLLAAGLDVRSDPFRCRWWEPGDASLVIDGSRLAVPPAPFSRPCQVHGPLTHLSTPVDLAAATIEPGRIIVIDGALTAEPYFPKAFPFLDLPEQRALLERLEALRPATVIAVAPSGGAMPLLEDGDLGFPYLQVTPEIGAQVLHSRNVGVRIGGALHDGGGRNLAARHGGDGPRVLLCAHLDSKATTPGAIDNAAGVATLLALAEAGLPADVPIELVFFDGEDHYQAPGEVAWLASADLEGIDHVINLDGVGARDHAPSVAMLACPPELEARVTTAIAAAGFATAEPWYESDHAMFAMRGIPSLALTSAGAETLLADVIHTERDTPDRVDPDILSKVVGFLDAWLRAGVPAGVPRGR